MNVEKIRQLFNQIIADSAWWSRLKDSQFVTYLVTFVAQIFFRAEQVSARRLQEAHLSRAQRYPSVLAHSESRGYVARKRIPLKKVVGITNDTGVDKYLPALSKIYSASSDLHFVNETPINIKADGKEYELELIQAQIQVVEFKVTEEKSFQEYLLPVQLSDKLSNINVKVTDPSGKEGQWRQSYKFRNTNASSHAYVEIYTQTEQLGVRFGNGVSGKVPELGSTVTLTCYVSDGFVELADGVKLEVLANESLKDLKIKSKRTLVVGSEREGMESIRNNALYHINYDNTVVFDGDYKFFTNQHIAGLTFFRVWGEKEQEELTGRKDLDFSSRVYLSAYHPLMDQALVMQAMTELYKNVKTLNVIYTPVACKMEKFTVTLTAKILSTQKQDEVVGLVRKALSERFGADASGHNGDISYDSIWRVIADLGLLVRFKVDVQGVDLDVSPSMDAFRYLDVSGSTINIAY